jgi:glycine cleavage system transcriptional repressor
MSLLAVTVIGHDRPGIIAAATAVLAEHGGNLEDSTMTILRGHFAMMLIVSAPAEPATIEAALGSLTEDGSLTVTVREVPPEPDVAALGGSYLLSVHGADRPGIVSAVTRVVADVGGNITDLTTRLSGELYVLVAEVDVPTGVDVDVLSERLAEVGRSLGVDVTFRAAEPDLL